MKSRLFCVAFASIIVIACSWKTPTSQKLDATRAFKEFDSIIKQDSFSIEYQVYRVLNLKNKRAATQTIEYGVFTKNGKYRVTKNNKCSYYRLDTNFVGILVKPFRITYTNLSFSDSIKSISWPTFYDPFYDFCDAQFFLNKMQKQGECFLVNGVAMEDQSKLSGNANEISLSYNSERGEYNLCISLKKDGDEIKDSILLRLIKCQKIKEFDLFSILENDTVKKNILHKGKFGRYVGYNGRVHFCT